MFEWEESTFLGLKSLYQRFVTKPQQREIEDRQAGLSDHRGSLILLARMLSGKNLGIFETGHRILSTKDRVCLPPQFHEADSVEANTRLYELKTIVAALAMRDDWTGNVYELANYVNQLSDEFPFLAEKVVWLENRLVDDEDTLWDILGAPKHTVESTAKDQLSAAVEELDQASVDITTEIEGKGQMDVEVLAAPEDDGHGADMPIHTFEKAECLEETSGLSRKTDDEDELEEHAEALKEVDMKEVMRSQERPKSIYRSDIILDGLNLEVNDTTPSAGIPYPEWDYRKRDYKQDWCYLQEKRNRENHPDWIAATEIKHAGLVAQLKRQFASLTSEYLKLKRQPNGNDFDIDAVIDSQVQLRTGHTPSEAIYLNQKKDIHDVAAVLLLDLSFSTDAWVRDVRVLDAIMETVYCVGEVIDGAIESFAVAGFSSNTRRSCRYELLKDFHEPWRKAKLHFGALQPQGYTRIGPALRHAHEMLLNQHASHKVAILVTDGRPCDYDRYEGTYGIRDVRKAIETGKLHGLRTHAFAIEKQATETFPMMFSRHHFDVVNSPQQLSQYMSKLFSKLIAS
ncbi:MAG: VWA domain-containing protein [Akkermansiaceae bacterium]|nr:VWA domain-containing protein [Akkermansiaceae bacterium]